MWKKKFQCTMIYIYVTNKGFLLLQIIHAYAIDIMPLCSCFKNLSQSSDSVCSQQREYMYQL